MENIKNILFVCTGNTCRSAMAKGIAEKIIEEQNLDINVESAGISAFENDPASLNAISALFEKGIDISGHSAKKITKELAQNADMIFVMTRAHYYAVVKAFPRVAKKVFLLNENGISDPFGGDMEIYKKSAEQIEKSIVKIIGDLKNGTQG